MYGIDIYIICMHACTVSDQHQGKRNTKKLSSNFMYRSGYEGQRKHVDVGQAFDMSLLNHIEYIGPRDDSGNHEPAHLQRDVSEHEFCR